MAKVFVIGDRLKDEWISVLDTENKKLEFASQLAAAKEYEVEEDARMDLKEIQQTGYFGDLQVYYKDGDKALKTNDRDPFQL